MIRKLWLVFCQTATVCVAALFVVTTLRPDLLAWSPRGSVVTIREAQPEGEAKKNLLVQRRREARDARGREHLHDQGNENPAASLHGRSGVPPFLRRAVRRADAQKHEPGLGRHRERAGLHPHQQPRRRGRRRDRGRARRHAARQSARRGHRSRDRSCRAQDRPADAAFDPVRTIRSGARRRRGAGDRQSVRRRPDRDARHHQRARPQPPRHQYVRELHPDRRGDQPRQLRAARWSIRAGS